MQSHYGTLLPPRSRIARAELPRATLAKRAYSRPACCHCFVQNWWVAEKTPKTRRPKKGCELEKGSASSLNFDRRDRLASTGRATQNLLSGKQGGGRHSPPASANSSTNYSRRARPHCYLACLIPVGKSKCTLAAHFGRTDAGQANKLTSAIK